MRTTLVRMTNQDIPATIMACVLTIVCCALLGLALFGTAKTLAIIFADDDSPEPKVECAAEDEVLVTLDGSLYCVHIDALRVPQA